MLILSCNVGSTSFKYRLYDLSREERELAQGQFEGVARTEGNSRHQAPGGYQQVSDVPADSYAAAIDESLGFLRQSGALPAGSLPDAVAFKTVAALGYTGVQALTEDVLAAMEGLNTLLPAHNPPYVAAIRQFARMMPSVPLIGSFETGFFSDMQPAVYSYPLPAELAGKGIRRNGAHGASHEYVAGWVAQREGREDLRIVSCHLGGSSSMAAIVGGRGVDTTIGMSMQTGLPHNNRAGDIDPYLIFYFMETLGYSAERVKQLYTKESGLLGLSGGLSADLRQIQQAADAGNVQARIAIEAFSYQIRKQIGAFAAAMGGLDVVAFTGGIGQHSVSVRAGALTGLDFLGILLDAERNAQPPEDGLISTPKSPVRVYTLATNEEIIIARKAKAYLEG